MPRRYSMDRRAAEHDVTQRQILDAVIEVAARSGLDALTIQAVAAQADVAVRTVYNHFDTREALIAAALGNLADETRTAVRSITVDEADGAAQLLAFIDGYLRSYEAQGPAVRVLIGAIAIPEVAAAVADVRAWRREQIRTLLRRARVEGRLELPPSDAATIAYWATAYSTFDSLTRDAGLSPSAARAIVRTTIERALFTSA